MPGTFVTFEGGEGTGKSTQIGRLAARLREHGRDVVVTREPGGTPEAEALRALLVSGEPGRWTAKAEALLNFAARDSHLTQVIRPTLEQGMIVLSDRFMDSTRVYQGTAGGVDAHLIDMLERTIVGETKPDLTLIFDLDPALGLQRAKLRDGGEDRYERKGLEFHSKLRDGFLKILRREPNRCRLVDAALPADEVEQTVWSIVETRL